MALKKQAISRSDLAISFQCSAPQDNVLYCKLYQDRYMQNRASHRTTALSFRPFQPQGLKFLLYDFSVYADGGFWPAVN
jgi:hypothetical protein